MKNFKERMLDSGWTIIIGIAVFGPFALPLLWRNPRYGRGTKVFWTLVTAVITVFCLWAMKYSALNFSNAMAAEPCRLERYRPAYPPGERAVKVFSGDSKKPVAKFSNSKELFDYLKQANGKACDVRWAEVKDTIENWMNTVQSAEDTVGGEIKTLVAEQATPSKAPPSTQPVTQTQPATQSTNSCDTRLSQFRDRLSALKSKTYDSQKLRNEEIESILRSL
ncbi:MAG: hypothetical protein ACJ763_07605 [Bdellovibrionia bacterium]